MFVKGKYRPNTREEWSIKWLHHSQLELQADQSRHSLNITCQLTTAWQSFPEPPKCEVEIFIQLQSSVRQSPGKLLIDFSQTIQASGLSVISKNSKKNLRNYFIVIKSSHNLLKIELKNKCSTDIIIFLYGFLPILSSYLWMDRK